MGCDFYIVTLLEGSGERRRQSDDEDIVIEYKEDRGYYSLYSSNEDSDDEDAMRQAHQKQRESHENVRQLRSGSVWVDEAVREKYMAIVRDQYPEIEAVRDLARVTYTRLRT